MHAPPLEEYAPGLSLEWLYDGQIAAFTIKNVRREAVDSYIAKNLEVIRAWSPQQPYLAIHDGGPEMGFTPYLKARWQEVFSAINQQGLQGRVALVIPPTLVGRLMLLAQQGTRHQMKQVENAAFFRRKEAFQWLIQILVGHP